MTNTDGTTPASQAMDCAFTRRAAITLAILVLYRLGSLVPAPGIDPQVVFGDNGASAEMLSSLSGRLSYFALQLTPLFSVLLLAEVFKLAFADVRDWVNESARTRSIWNKGVLVAALLLATLQAWGVTAGLEQLDATMSGPRLIVEPGSTFRWMHVTGLIAGTALSIWLADQITRHGTGSGFWLLFLLPSVTAMAFAPAMIAPFIATGEVRLEAAIALACVLFSSAAAIAVLTRQWRQIAETHGAGAEAGGRFSNVMSIAVWPPFIAMSALGLIAAFVNFLVGLDPSAGEALWWMPGSLGSALWLAVLIPLLTTMAANAMLDSRTRALPETQRLIALTAAVAVMTCVAIDVLVAHFVPIRVAGPSWIALVTVLTLILPNRLSAPQPGSDDTAP